MKLDTYLEQRPTATPDDADTLTFVKGGKLYKVAKSALLQGLSGVSGISDVPGLVEALAARVQTVNGVAPDANGDVTVAGGGGGAAALDELSDVTITSPASGQVLKYNGSAWVNDTDSTGGGGGGDALVSQPLSQFAATTSAQLRGVISDETGSGALVFGTSPTIASPTLSGPVTSDGASITTAAAMAALAVDVAKMLNTKSISSNSTLTFSATPAAANTWFGLHLTNTSASPVTVTIPSSYSMGRQANITRFVMPGNGECWLTWRYTGAGYRLFGEPPHLNKFDATAAPTANDDEADGYGPGSTWLDATNDLVYVCESAAAGAAVWHLTSGGGASALPPEIQAYVSGSVTDGTIKLLLRAPFAFTIDEVAAQTEAGSCTVTTTIDGVALGGSANAAGTTEDVQTHSTANAVAVGQTVAIVISANAGAEGLSVIISGTRS